MEKKTLYIISVAVVAAIIIASVAIVMGNQNNNDDSKYVTYEGNGGVTSPSGSTSYKWYSDTVDEIKFFWDNHTLTEFNDKEDGTGKSYHTGDKVSYGTTLYAQWKLIELKVNITSNVPYASTISITYNGQPLENGAILSDPSCTFVIKLTNLDKTNSFEESLGGWAIYDSASNKICDISRSLLKHPDADKQTYSPVLSDDEITLTLKGFKELSLNINFVPPT